MNVLDEIRPRAEHLTDERSRQMLTAVLSSPVRRRKRRWKNRAAAVGLCGVIVAGGTAYGTGLVPGIVTDRFQQIREGEDGWVRTDRRQASGRRRRRRARDRTRWGQVVPGRGRSVRR